MIAGSLKRELYIYALKDNWDRAQSIFDKFTGMMRIRLTANGDTALHIAAEANSTTFVQGLVSPGHMSTKDLEIKNSDGNTAFCIAAISGNDDLFQTMVEKNKNLPLVSGHDGMLPVHLAALTGRHKIVQDLSSENLLEKMATNPKDIERLFFMTISSAMYGKNKHQSFLILNIILFIIYGYFYMGNNSIIPFTIKWLIYNPKPFFQINNI